MVRSLRGSTPVLLVDNGDVNNGYGRQPELKYETAMKAMAAIGYAAVNIGEQDMLLGVDYLRYVADFAEIPLLSANIVDTDGKPVFQPFILHTLQVGGNDVEVAVIGIISTSFKEEIESSNPGLLVEDYMPRLQQIMEHVNEKAAIVVVLAHMEDAEAAKLAAQFPHIDFLVASHSGDDPFMTPFIQEKVPIGFAGIEGKCLGVARFNMEKARPRPLEYEIIKLDRSFPGSPAIVSILQDYQHMVKAEKLVESFTRVEHGEAQFTGNQGCRKCHQTSFPPFSKDKHARAFDALVKEGNEYDPECVGCHTVGFGYTSGFMSHDISPELEHVGCESCHGPGSTHAANAFEKGYGGVTEETCRSCHDLANSPNFDYGEYSKKLIPHADSGLAG